MGDELVREYDREPPVDWNAEFQEAIGERIQPHHYWRSEPPLDELPADPYSHMLFPELATCPGGVVNHPRLVGDTPEMKHIEADCPGRCGGIAGWSARLHQFGAVIMPLD